MKTSLLSTRVLLALLVVALTALTPPQRCSAAEATEDIHELKIGDAAPDFSLPGIDGKTHTLADYNEAKLLMVGFLSNHCPSSHAIEGRLKSFLEEMKVKGLRFVAINPNNPDGLSIDELGYSKYNDGFDDMKKYAAEQGFNFPYLYDGETQSAAKAYGCLATPHIFIFDAARKLRYKGHFDESEYAATDSVKSPDARRAVEALLAGKAVPVEVTKPHGCSTKWMSKKKSVTDRLEKWEKTPVDLLPIDLPGVAALRKGGTKNIRLFNVWATWCGPCVEEFPELVKTSRKFDMRNFELITISVDDAKDAAKAKAFLEKSAAGLSDRAKKSVKAEGRTSNSYLFPSDKLDDLMNVLDPAWKGAIPHSVLVNTNGEVIWRHNGPLDGDELRAKVLEHLGVFYTP